MAYAYCANPHSAPGVARGREVQEPQTPHFAFGSGWPHRRRWVSALALVAAALCAGSERSDNRSEPALWPGDAPQLAAHARALVADTPENREPAPVRLSGEPELDIEPGAQADERAARGTSETAAGKRTRAREATAFALDRVPRFAPAPLVPQRLDLGGSRQQISNLPTPATATDGRLTLEPLPDGNGSVAAASAPLLLPPALDAAQSPVILDSPLLRELQKQLLGAESLVNPQALLVPERKARFDLLQARAGEATARGYLARGARGPAGNLLLSTRYAKVDVEVLVDDVQVQFFLGDAWLPWFEPPKPPERDSQPR
jgi:hypothetical protein